MLEEIQLFAYNWKKIKDEQSLLSYETNLILQRKIIFFNLLNDC